MKMFGERSTQIEDLYQLPVVAYVSKPKSVCNKLHTEERRFLENTVSKRKDEFGTARLLARSALTTCGIKSGSLVPNTDRSPRWPNGVVGSISHSSNLCCSVVTTDIKAASIGFDVESIHEIGSELDYLILTSHEVAFKNEAPSRYQDDLTGIYFSIKEAIYKCQYPITRDRISFKDVEVELELESERYSIRSENSKLRDVVKNIYGSFRVTSEHVMASSELIKIS